MPTNTNTTPSTSNGVSNRAQGQIVTTSAAAAALTITCGFVPRKITFENCTDRIKDEWYYGLDENGIYAAIIGITAKLDADAGVTDTDYGSLWNPTAATITALVTSLTGILAKLDADAGVTDTNYATLWTPSATIASLKASIAGMNAKLDADGGVTDVNYASTWNCPAIAIHTVAAGTRTFALTNGIVNNYDGTFTLNSTTMVASKTFVWEAVG